VSSSITGTSTFYASGGGGAGRNFQGTASAGGGGNAGASIGIAGTANTGGGGGGGSGQGLTGGSGVVIISYPSPQKFGGGIVSVSGANTIHTFTTSGTLSPLSSLTASALIVAGGGGGGAYTGVAYVAGTNGGNSSISIYSTASVGGGGGGVFPGGNAGNGGSGGGGSGYGTTTAGTGTAGQGFAGGIGQFGGGNGYWGGGGGGAGAVGADANSTNGNGGVGLQSSISGTSTYYAGGGGGGSWSASGGSAGTGGLGGGGNGGFSSSGSAGTANTGGGGGGGDNGSGAGNGGGGAGGMQTISGQTIDTNSIYVVTVGSGGAGSAFGGAGGSGVVIISYPGSTQQMAGGTVTVAGGNVIHTFTSSGYLTPLTLVGNSLRFRGSATAYLSRTPSTAGNTTTWTWSAWVKRGTLGGSVDRLFNSNDSGSPFNQSALRFDSDQLRFFSDANGSTSDVQSTAVFRDPAAWYHIVLAYDSTQATSSNRVKLYVNGSQITALATATYCAQNTATYINAARSQQIGSSVTATQTFDGYMTDINFIDGQALTPNSFGTFNGLGVWQPIRYGGSYGTNGFYLPFTNTASTTTLGLDFSPQGNNWTTNNISLTAGATFDSMTDVPTLTNATTANYCTLNPVNPPNGVTISSANLNFACTDDTTAREAFATFGVKTGKWYFEATKTNSCDRFYTGIVESIYKPGQGISFGKLRFDTSSSSNITIMFAVDFNAGLYWGGVSGTFTGDPAAGTGGTSFTVGSNDWVALVGGYRETQPSAVGNINFGQRPFAYTPPTGFNRLNTFNLPTPTIGATAATQAGKNFDATTFTATGTTQTITNTGFQPDFLWFKNRGVSQDHFLFTNPISLDQYLSSNTTAVEVTSATFLDTVNSNGFTMGTGNFANGASIVCWNWKAGGAAVTNTAGSITSQVSANTTSGFSVVTYTGTGANATVGHGLGVAPSWVIVKGRNVGSTNWFIYTAQQGATKYLDFSTGTGGTDASSWNNTAPTSSVFSVGTSFYTNFSATTYVAYCFAPVAGYSSFGSYTGNGSADGPFVYLGFRPRYIMWKRSDSTGDWIIFDTARDTFNYADKQLVANTSGAEAVTGGGFVRMDFLSNGFKIRSTDSYINANGGTYIYMAFAENPFKYANAR
jgi:hypothetical protein